MVYLLGHPLPGEKGQGSFCSACVKEIQAAWDGALEPVEELVAA
jgi:hypothetical protein